MTLKRKKIGLLVIHGIGEQKPGETLDRFLNSFHRCFPPPSRPRALRVSDKNESWIPSEIFSYSEDGPDIMAYEVHWAEVLSGDRVRGTFEIQALHQFLWFPLFNRNSIEAYRKIYPGWLVWAWLIVLSPITALLTAAYYGLPAWQPFFVMARRAWCRIQRAPVPDHDFLDSMVADLFNYVKSAAGIDGPLKNATEEIYQKFHSALDKAVNVDGCTEIRILAHSLGTVVAYHALTRFRKETSMLIRLDENAMEDNKPVLTRLYTTGSPLEKIRFFWPKIAAESIHFWKGFEWYNFVNPKDRIAGILKRYDGISSVRNVKILGTGGLVTSHTRYLESPSFHAELYKSLTGKTKRPARPDPNYLNKLWGWMETLAVPLGLICLSLFGLVFMLAVGWLIGTIVGGVPYLIGEGSKLLSITVWDFPAESLSRAQQFFAWFVPGVLVIVAILVGKSEGRQIHRQHWQNVETIDVMLKPDRPGSGRGSRSSGSVNDRRYTMEKTGPPRKYWHLAANVCILIAIVAVGVKWDPTDMQTAWLIIMGLMLSFMVIFSHGITGDWRAVLIDGRFRLSLGRLQLMTWTLLVLSALLAAVLKNLALGWGTPLEIDIPSELWILMGISTASAVSAPAVLANKRNLRPDSNEKKIVRKALKKQNYAKPTFDSIIITNRRFEDARWGDLLKGEETGNAASVDLGKIQMFFFSFIIVISYGIAISRLLAGNEPITQLPTVDEGMNVLLGISHTGYIANKAVSHSKAEEPQEGQPNSANEENRADE